MTRLDNLLSIASSPLSDHEPKLSSRLRDLAGTLADDLLTMLMQSNGFYAYESALHVFSTHTAPAEMNLEDWNKEGLWRSAYQGLADNCLFFAEDVFGGQFCIKNDEIYAFDPETGGLEYLASDIEGWVNVIFEDYEMLTGYPLAHDWQKLNGRIPLGSRLLPKIPFIAGGDFTLGNLYLSHAVDGMKFRAEIAVQIKDLPEGARIEINFSD